MANCYFCYKDAGTAAYHARCSNNFFGNTIIPEIELNREILNELAERTVNQRIAVTGVQPKLSVDLELNAGTNRLTITSLWGKYILKPQQGLYAFMPETEDLTMHLASLFKIPVAQHTLLPASDGQLVYLAKRFDRIGDRKLHLEDFCQLSGLLTEQKYKSSYERAGKLINTYSSTRGLDSVNYFELVLFSYLSGNNDMHLKNFSLIEDGRKINLSPAYDLLNVNIIFPEDREELALTLNGRKNRIRLADFLVLGRSLAIPEKTLENIFKKFSSKNDEVAIMINSSFLDEALQAKYIESWRLKQKLFHS